MNALPADASPDASLRWLRVLLAISVLAPAIVFVASAGIDYVQTLELARQRVTHTLRLADEHARNVLETTGLVLDRVDDVLRTRYVAGVRGGDATLAHDLGSIAAELPQVRSLWVLDASGNVVAATAAPPAVAATVAGHAVASGASGTGALVTGVMRGGHGETFLTISRRHVEPDGEAEAVGVTLDPREIDRLYRDLVRDHSDVTLRLFAIDGTLVRRYPQLGPLPPRLDPRSPWLALARGGVAYDVSAADSAQGRRQLVAFAPVGAYGLYVGTSLPFAAIEREWVDRALVTLAFALAAMVALGSVSWMALRRTEQERAVRREWQREAGRRAAAEKALRESQRMEAMGQLTGGVAHDFNNLLMVVSGNLQILRKRLATGPHDRQLDAMAQAVQRGVTLTRHLLAFSRRQALLPRSIDLAEAMPALTELVSHSLRENIRLACHVAPGTWHIRADRAELELALLNIAVNARDAMPGGGTLTLTVRNAGVADMLSLGGEMSGEFVLIAAHDTGEGIPVEVLPRVFEPFFTTKAPGKGTGLGLSQVYGFSRQSGGTVTLQSPPGRGTTVTLWLPRSIERDEMPVAAPAAPTAQRAGRILVVEDDATVSGVLAELLADLGYDVETAASGAEALAKLHAGPRVDLLLSDVVMLGAMNGLQLARTVRSRFASMPVILMTGYAAELARIAAEGFTVLMKPFDLPTLAGAIDKVRSGSRGEDRATEAQHAR